jgi:hypothetical protein
MNPIRTAHWAALALAAALVGCDSSTAPSSSPSSTPAPSPGGGPPPPGKAAKPAEGKKAEAAPAKPLDVAGTKLSDKEILAIEKIEPEGDRKIALEQKLCPMTGAHLGSMGKPFQGDAQGPGRLPVLRRLRGGRQGEARRGPGKARQMSRSAGLVGTSM